jgi:uncharacterized protein YbaP (TraB family)
VELAAAAPPAGAEAPPAGDSLEGVVVTGERSGPGLWQVTRGNGTVWILATVAPLPKDITWRSRELEDILAGASGVLVSKHLEVGIIRVLWLLLTQRQVLMLPGGQRLKDVMPADVYARFAAQRAKYTKDPQKWERFRPIIATAFLQEDALSRVGLSNRLDLGGEVRSLARKHDVPVDEITVAGIKDMLDTLKTVPPQTEERCVAGALATIESGLPRLVERARAWATGDVERLERLPYSSEVDDCRSALEADATAGDLVERIRRTWLASIDRRLDRGGVTVALVNMDLLLEPGGLLDLLRAQGCRVEAPGAPTPSAAARLRRIASISAGP